MSYNELRKGRCSIVGQIYFVTTVINHRRPLFDDFHLARQMVLNMKQIEDEGYLLSHAWVIMPDHLHWLF